LDLFAVGAGIVFLAFGGVYTFVRERYLDGTPREKAVEDAAAGRVTPVESA
jgi:hypothetical protein